MNNESVKTKTVINYTTDTGSYFIFKYLTAKNFLNYMS